MCMAWCVVERGRDVEWCTEMWWSELMWIIVRCEMRCDVYVKCGVMWNAAISDRVWCGMRFKYKMCDVEYGVLGNVVSWYMECCIMQDAES